MHPFIIFCSLHGVLVYCVNVCLETKHLICSVLFIFK